MSSRCFGGVVGGFFWRFTGPCSACVAAAAPPASPLRLRRHGWRRHGCGGPVSLTKTTDDGGLLSSAAAAAAAPPLQWWSSSSPAERDAASGKFRCFQPRCRAALSLRNVTVSLSAGR